MDKKSLIGFIIIAVILVLYPYYIRLLPHKEVTPPPTQESASPVRKAPQYHPPPTVSSHRPSAPGLVVPPSNGAEREIRVTTPLYRAILSTKGGVVKSWRLRNYLDYQGHSVELLPPRSKGALGIIFSTFGGRLPTSSWIFSSSSQDSLVLGGADSVGEVSFSFVSQEINLTKTFKFFSDRYSCELEITAAGLDSLANHYLLEFPDGMNVTERDSVADLRDFASYTLWGGELVKAKLRRENRPSFREGATQWVATKSKYFLFAALPLGGDGSGYGLSGGKRMGVSLQREFEGGGFQQSFRIYLGPLDYFALKRYGVGLERTVGIGEGFLGKVIGPIGVVVLWFFIKLHGVIHQYGLVLILFSLLMKLLFYPLTYKSLSSMRKMQKVQPKLAHLREKYKKNPQKLNQELMKLYKEQGVNPLGGCLPLLLQIPVFWALFQVFRSTIELRGERFLWVKDLSRPDLVQGIPVLAIIMGITMFIQQKQSIKDPKQKAMVYLMPVLFVFLFRSFPAGLVLYWTVFNLLTIGQQYILEKVEG